MVRLTACAEFVGGAGTVCDVGTDHAYLAALLAERCPRVIASDINDGPLAAARATVARLGLGAKISVVKSDGLREIDLAGVSDIVIAGMGGETICGILSASLAAPRDFSGINFVLQPMTKIPLLRARLYALGFEIVEERTVFDGRIFVVVKAKYTGISREITPLFSEIGLLAADRDYVEKQAKKLAAEGKGLLTAGELSAALAKLRLCQLIMDN